MRKMSAEGFKVEKRTITNNNHMDSKIFNDWGFMKKRLISTISHYLRHDIIKIDLF